MRRTQKRRNNKRKSVTQKGGGALFSKGPKVRTNSVSLKELPVASYSRLPLPDVSKLRFELIANDNARNQFTNSYEHNYVGDEFDAYKIQNIERLEWLQTFCETHPSIGGISLTLNTHVTNDDFTDFMKTVDETEICNGKISIRKLTDAFQSYYASIYCIRMFLEDKLIGLVIFNFTHNPPFYRYGTAIDESVTYIHLDYLCGSSYQKVGTLLIQVLKLIATDYSARSIHLISYDSAIPFYEKMGFTYLGLSWAKTPVMEFAT